MFLHCSYHHPNLVTILGVCTDVDHPAVVYELMSNGSLWDWLFTKRVCVSDFYYSVMIFVYVCMHVNVHVNNAAGRTQPRGYNAKNDHNARGCYRAGISPLV